MVLIYANVENLVRRLGVPGKMCRLGQKNLTLIKTYETSSLKEVRGKVLISVTSERSGACEITDKRSFV